MEPLSSQESSQENHIDSLKMVEKVVREFDNVELLVCGETSGGVVKPIVIGEFAANNTANASTGYTPFYLNSGTNPVIPLSLMSVSLKTHNKTVSGMLDRMKRLLEDGRSNLQAAQGRATPQANKPRKDENFDEGDEAVLSTRILRAFDMNLRVKLRRRRTGPFKIVKKISLVTYRLDLPPG